MVSKQSRRGATQEVVSAEDASLVVHVIDRDRRSLAEHASVIRSLGYRVEAYAAVDELDSAPPASELILLCQRSANDLDRLRSHLSEQSLCHPMIVASVDPKPQQVVDAIRQGVLDYLALPLDLDHLGASLHRVSELVDTHAGARLRALDARQRIARLSTRERQVFEGVANGLSNKVIARELGISPRTVEIHRAHMMDKLDVGHAGQVIRMALIAGVGELKQVSGEVSVFPWADGPGETP